ncbi:MAG: hypothetical protein IJ461_06355 [Clostridia bacterium]|nr:hypothetical protein [Clostridia bacterium]
MKGKQTPNKAYIQSYRHRTTPALQSLGILLIALGMILLFICIPGWAWAAAAGILLIGAGYLLVRINSGGR